MTDLPFTLINATTGGSVKYLNAVPLTRGIESEITFTTPAKLAEMLRRDELDAALVSITEVLLNDRYDILDGIAIPGFDRFEFRDPFGNRVEFIETIASGLCADDGSHA